MKHEEIKTIKLEFDANEVETLKSTMKKLESETGKVGFSSRSDLNGDEINLIREINEKINPKP